MCMLASWTGQIATSSWRADALQLEAQHGNELVHNFVGGRMIVQVGGRDATKSANGVPEDMLVENGTILKQHVPCTMTMTMN